MSRPIVREHNIQTNKISEREMNDSEFVQFQKDQAEATERTTKEAEAAAAKAALLAKLGITEEEARLLLGGN